MTQPNLENMLMSIASLTDISEKIGRSKTPQEQSQLYNATAQMIGGKKGSEGYERAMRELTRDPAYALIQTEGARDNLAKQAKETYETEMDRIVEEVTSKINENLGNARSKAKASMILSQYLSDILMNTPEITQEEADQIEQEQVKSMGLPYAFEARGSVSQYKDLMLRQEASKYLIETEEGKYSINKDKLSEAMKDVVKGASLYGRVKMMEMAQAERTNST